MSSDDGAMVRIGKCRVCGNRASDFSYGIVCCNTCKLRYRRVVDSPKSVESCDDQKCENCRFCEFQKATLSGFQLRNFQKFQNFPKLIDQLIILDENRRTTFSTWQMMEDPGLDQLMDPNFEIKIIRKSGNSPKFRSHDWVLMEIFTTIGFMKNMDLSRLLSSMDLKMFIKNSYFKSSILFIAIRSYLDGGDKMTFPEDVDVFPEEIAECPDYNEKLLTEVRNRLVQKFIELKVTNQELLLLSVIIFCDPAAPCLSDHARIVVSQFQQIYKNVLMDYCTQKFQKSGPPRFMEILFLGNLVTKTMVDLDAIVTLFRIYQPALPLRNLVKESF